MQQANGLIRSRALAQRSAATLLRLSWLLFCAALVYFTMPRAWAQQNLDPYEEQIARPSVEQLKPTDSGVLNKILWNENTLVIDGKSYRFQSEAMRVFYLNKERTIVGLREGSKIRFQLVDEDYVLAIWVDNPGGMIVG